jgi:uncharacterized membrane protein
MISPTHLDTPATQRLPEPARITMAAPARWLADAWKDLWSVPGPCLLYGLGLTLVSGGLAAGLVFTGHANWFLVAVGGFMFVAPMLGMGLYAAGQSLERGRKPTLSQMLFVRTASARDLALLGLALALVYFFWGRMAQLIYLLSTSRLHTDFSAFMTFLLTTREGLTMAAIGTAVGGFIAFIAYSLVVVAAPMLLDRRTDVFVASVTSVRAVMRNFGPMLLWALMIVTLTGIGIATAFIGLIVIFPWIGLASWRAYRELVPTL